MEKVKIYTMANCPYCTKLKSLLDEKQIAYTEIEVDTEEGEKAFIELQKVSKSDMLPAIIVDNKVLAPDISFKTIEEAISIIEMFIS